MTQFTVAATRDNRNRTTLTIPEGAKPGDTIVIDKQVTPMRCLECLTSDFGEGCVAISAKAVLRLVEQRRGPEEQDMSKPVESPTLSRTPAVVGSGISF